MYTKCTITNVKKKLYDVYELKLYEMFKIAQQKPCIYSEKKKQKNKKLLHTNLILARHYFIQTDSLTIYKCYTNIYW